MAEIIKVRSSAEVDEVRALAWEFVDWVRGRYPEQAANIDAYFKAQNFEAQLDALLDTYGPPRGECLLAQEGGRSLGTVMLKPHASGGCEMNRMFLRPEARGRGIGRLLGEAIVAAGRDLGYPRMILVAGPKHDEALPLYAALGFQRDDSLPDTGAGDMEIRMSRAL